MVVVDGWRKHLEWAVPLLLIPLSIIIFRLVALMAMPGSDGLGATWLLVIAIVCAVAAPIVLLILTIIGAQKTYRSSRMYARKMQKRNERSARRLERQIVAEGGPRCDYGDRTQPLQLFSPNTAATSVLIVRQLKGAGALRAHPAIKPISARAVAG